MSAGDYSTPATANIWTDRAMLETWRDIEIAVLEAQQRHGIVTKVQLSAAKDAKISLVLWREATEEVGHELVAFLRTWGAPIAHIGLTSSDITDTGLALRLTQTNNVLVERALRVDAALADMAEDDHLRLGRTHGQPAAPMAWSQVVANWQQALRRWHVRFQEVREQVEVAKISGPVGSYLHVSREIECEVADALGLNPVAVATQIVMRDSLAAWAAECGTLASIVEAIAGELRLMAHHQIGEGSERGGSSSSAMPHKVNPNRLERLSGLARVVRSAYEPIACGVAQWHERDMAHSSVERMLVPQTACTLDYMLDSLAEILTSYELDTVRIGENYRDNALEAHMHSVQTAIQRAGHGHAYAQEATREIYDRVRPLKAAGSGPTIQRLHDDPLFNALTGKSAAHPFGTYVFPIPHTEHLEEE